MADVAITESVQIVAIESSETIQTATIESVEIGYQGPPGPPGASGGSTYSAIAGEPLSGQRAVRMSGGKLYYCSAGNAGHFGLYLGITRSAALTNATIAIQRAGQIVYSGWNWTIGLPIFCGINGVLTQNTSGLSWIQQIGLAIKADTILLDPYIPIAKV